MNIVPVHLLLQISGSAVMCCRLIYSRMCCEQAFQSRYSQCERAHEHVHIEARDRRGLMSSLLVTNSCLVQGLRPWPRATPVIGLVPRCRPRFHCVTWYIVSVNFIDLLMCVEVALEIGVRFCCYARISLACRTPTVFVQNMWAHNIEE